MKNFGILTVAATAVLSSTVAHAGYSINSNYWRAGTTNGLGGVLSNMLGWGVYGGGSVAGITATAPAGLNSWAAQGSETNYLWAYGPAAWDGSTFGTPSFDVAAASAWHENNGRGVWSFNNGGTTSTVDTAPYWTSVENRVFNELDAASSQLYFDILANGSTGTFTFNLKQAAVANSRWFLAPPTGGAGGSTGQITTGATSFSVTIAQALTSDFWLQLAHNSNVNFGNFGNDNNFNQSSGVAYGTAISVPAPGALALLGLAGFAGRRRR